MEQKKTDEIRESIIPFKAIIEQQINVYETTSASIRRAEQITLTSSEELKKKKIKIVSQAMKEVMSGDVKFDYKE
jgi:DNA-directed RNA polymerase subunit K/omega